MSLDKGELDPPISGRNFISISLRGLKPFLFKVRVGCLVNCGGLKNVKIICNSSEKSLNV